MDFQHALLCLKDLIHLNEALVLAGSQILGVRCPPRCPFQHCLLPTSVFVLWKCRTCSSHFNHLSMFTGVSSAYKNPSWPWHSWCTFFDMQLQAPPERQSFGQEDRRWCGNKRKLRLVWQFQTEMIVSWNSVILSFLDIPVQPYQNYALLLLSRNTILQLFNTVPVFIGPPWEDSLYNFVVDINYASTLPVTLGWFRWPLCSSHQKRLHFKWSYYQQNCSTPLLAVIFRRVYLFN